MWLTTVAMLLVGAAPFLGLQLILNLGVTGKPLVSPYVLYLKESQPGSTFGTGAVQGNAPLQSALPQKQIYYRWLLTMDQEQRDARTYRDDRRSTECNGTIQPA